jgi:TetR/AcrR family transcriptional regulator, transcriptional repressor for nem operon
MPWPKEHKAQTRARIVDAAASAFREAGVSQVAVGDVMRRAGLTHGGFYAHFDSKDDLLADAVPHAMSDSAANLDRIQGAAPKGLLGLANAYLSREHMSRPEAGCPIAALGPELTRAAQSVRQSLGREVRKRLDQLIALIPSTVTPERRRQHAAGAAACMVGGIVLARAMNERERSAFLADCRAFLADALAEVDSAT